MARLRKLCPSLQTEQIEKYDYAKGGILAKVVCKVRKTILAHRCVSSTSNLASQDPFGLTSFNVVTMSKSKLVANFDVDNMIEDAISANCVDLSSNNTGTVDARKIFMAQNHVTEEWHGASIGTPDKSRASTHLDKGGNENGTTVALGEPTVRAHAQPPTEPGKFGLNVLSDVPKYSVEDMDVGGSVRVRKCPTPAQSKTGIEPEYGIAVAWSDRTNTPFPVSGLDQIVQRQKRYSYPPTMRTWPSESHHAEPSLAHSGSHGEICSSVFQLALNDTSLAVGSGCWAKVRPACIGKTKNTECLMKVSHKETVYREALLEGRSEIAAMETILSARDVELANLEEDHEAVSAEAEELRRELQETETRLKAQTKALRHANNRLRVIEKLNGRSGRDMEQLRTGNAALQRVLGIERAKNAELERENRDATLDIDFFALQNAFYRYEMEYSDPARTALSDGILQRKDEAIIRREEDLEACYRLLAEERKGYAIDKAKAEEESKRFKHELEDLTSSLEQVSNSRATLQEQFNKVAEMFRSKIYHNDMVKAICDSHEVITQDNAFLIAALQKRHSRAKDAYEHIASYKTEVIELNCTIEANKQKEAQLEGEKSRLVQRVDELEWKDELHEQALRDMKESYERKLWVVSRETLRVRQEINIILETSLDGMSELLVTAMQQKILELQETVERCALARDQLYNKLLEQGRVIGQAFSYWARYMGIHELNCEDLKRRLQFADQHGSMIEESKIMDA
ncbi:MAG: hypothetical protein Q9163_004058 [Psora crenata]